MRRRAGLGAIQKQRLEQEKYKDKSNELQENQLEQMSKQLEFFKTNLEDFASKHKNEIKKNPEFRRQFQVLDLFLFSFVMALYYFFNRKCVPVLGLTHCPLAKVFGPFWAWEIFTMNWLYRLLRFV